jgi:RNA polymerase sigma factor (sigma-70 family)
VLIGTPIILGNMRTRQGITDIFSMFLVLDSDRSTGWATDARLRRSILHSQSELSQPENSPNYWVVFWYKKWQSQPTGLAQGHLSAYLQEVCYWAAQKTTQSVTATQYTLSDFFQLAIARVEKVLKGYKPDAGFKLNSYASAVFSSELKEMLRQQGEIDICTNWRLLRKITQKRLIEALQNAGQGADTIERYVFAWKCFLEQYVPQQATGTRKLPKPEAATWEAIAQQFNSGRHSRLSQPGKESNAESIEKWMIESAKAARNYMYPSVDSINQQQSSDPDSREVQDTLPSKEETALSHMIAQEEECDRALQQSQINEVLITAMVDLDQELKTILELYYRQGQTQQQIAKQLDIQQFTISRRLKKAREKILVKLATWCKETLHISLNSTVLDYINTVMEEWLKTYFNPPQDQ